MTHSPPPRPPINRTQLQQIIAGLPEGVIIISPDRTIAWCNQAALTMHGVTSQKELGPDVAEYRQRFELRYRNQHKLAPDDYPMERVAAGETFEEVIVEVARPGEDRRRVQQIRSLVVADAQGQADFFVLIIDDETERFDAEQRFERAFNANPAPALIVRFSDLRYVRVNQGFLEMTGYVRENLIGRSMHEIDLLEAAEKRDLAMERLHAGATIPQMEAVLPVPGGHGKTVILAGQPIEIGDEACMLFTFADLHPRKQAEDALRQSEQRFAVAFRMAPGPMAIIALEGLRLLDVNDAFTAATGWRREEVIGRTEAELGLWGTGPAREEYERLVKQTGHLRGVDVHLEAKGGRASDYLLSAETVRIHGEHCVLTVMLDITERKQTEVDLRAAIEAVMHDSSWLGQKIVEKLTGLSRQNAAVVTDPVAVDLTARARDVLSFVAEGLSDATIAEHLGISPNTVRNHVAGLFRNVGVHRRSELVVWARERGFGGGGKLRKTG